MVKVVYKILKLVNYIITIMYQADYRYPCMIDTALVQWLLLICVYMGDEQLNLRFRLTLTPKQFLHVCT